MWWRFRGAPAHLARQARRLGVSQEFVHISRHNPEMFRVATLLMQVCEQWHRARKENGYPVLASPDWENIKTMLARCEIETRKLHVLAAAADEMVAEAWEAFGVVPARRGFRVTTDPVTDILSLGDGTVGIADDEPDPVAPSSIEGG